MAVSRAAVEVLIERLEPSLRKAFQDALNDWRNNVDLQAVAAALQRGDVDGAIRAANIQPAALNGLLNAREIAFDAAGAAELTGLRLNILFNVRDLRAEAQLSQYAATFVQGITDNARAMLRTVLSDGLSRGQGAMTTARQIRSWIGITDNQAGYALNLRRKLETYPKSLLAEFQAGGYKLRDARLDGIVRRAVASGEPIPPKDIDTIVTAYKNRSIAWRAKNIARSETLRAVNAGRYEAYQQAVSSGKVAATAVRRVWNATHDLRTRDTHREMDKQSVGLNDTFQSSSGASLRYPGDPFSPIAETINCRCNLTYRIDHLANIR